jgi:hypothetical protein
MGPYRQRIRFQCRESAEHRGQSCLRQLSKPAAACQPVQRARRFDLRHPRQQCNLPEHVAPGEPARRHCLDAGKAEWQNRHPVRFRHVCGADHHRYFANQRRLLDESDSGPGRLQPVDYAGLHQRQQSDTRGDSEQSVPERNSESGRVRRRSQHVRRTECEFPEPEHEEPVFCSLEFQHPAGDFAQHGIGGGLHRQPLCPPARHLHESECNPAPLPEHVTGPRPGGDQRAVRHCAQPVPRPGDTRRDRLYAQGRQNCFSVPAVPLRFRLKRQQRIERCDHAG